MYVYNTINIPIHLTSSWFLAAHNMQDNDVMTTLTGKAFTSDYPVISKAKEKIYIHLMLLRALQTRNGHW